MTHHKTEVVPYFIATVPLKGNAAICIQQIIYLLNWLIYLYTFTCIYIFAEDLQTPEHRKGTCNNTATAV